MVNIADILFDLCEDDSVYQPGTDLINSGLLDSFATIELFSRLEDEGIFIQLTRIDRTKLHTVEGIEELVNDYLRNPY
ncbi:MAG: D-alanine--poly(phosphoribitol) ligase subunit 2 [Clostridia bacterium]|nr:D-alanine--poly(phosphoribitol) ligase subunit 2 [Clostridia bacterium]